MKARLLALGLFVLLLTSVLLSAAERRSQARSYGHWQSVKQAEALLTATALRLSNASADELRQTGWRLWRFSEDSAMPERPGPDVSMQRALNQVRSRQAWRASRSDEMQLVWVDTDHYLVIPGGGEVLVVWWPPLAEYVEERTRVVLQGGGERPSNGMPLLLSVLRSGEPLWGVPPSDLNDSSATAWDLIRGTLIVLLLIGLAADRVSAGLQSAREQAATETRQALLQRLSHELRTPAAAVRALADAAEALEASPDEERAQFHELLRLESARLADGIDRMLQAARGELSVSVQPVDMDLVEWSQGVVTRWEARLGGLEVIAPEHLPAAADPERLDEAIDALLDNAAKYGRPPTRLSLERRGATIYITVEDGGDGIPSADRARVLERAERVEGRPGDPGGFGLGLWAVAEVARAHGGELRLEDKSRFVMTLNPSLER